MTDPPAGVTPLRVLGRESAPAPTAVPLWESLYRDHVTLVYRFVHARVGNRPDAEDLTSDVFIRALPRLRLGASAGEIRGYLLTTARTILADFWSRAYAVPAGSLDGEPAPAGGVDGEAADRDRTARVDALLRRLSDTHRAVLELRFLRGYSIKETARALGLTTANTKVIQWRALRRAATLDEEARA